MLFLGTIINVFTVLAGSLIGYWFGKRLPDRIIKSIFQVMGLFTVFLGVYMAFKGEQLLVMIFALILGVIVGELLRIETFFEGLSERLKLLLKIENQKFTEGMLVAFLLFCMGSMTILGAIDEGVGNGSELLLTKAIMDGFSSIALASAFGIGVTFSIIPLFIFQAGITLLAWYLGSFISETIINDLTGVVGIIINGLGLNILELKKIKVMNMLPALLFAILFSWLVPVLTTLF